MFHQPFYHHPYSKHATVIVWFRRDLRLSDNPALAAAVQSSINVVRYVGSCHVVALGLLRPSGTSCVFTLHSFPLNNHDRRHRFLCTSGRLRRRVNSSLAAAVAGGCARACLPLLQSWRLWGAG